jgi:four helix bundle protein
MPNSFEDLDAFKQAVALSVHVYRTSESFPREERYGITSQVRRAATSVVRHLAEGQGRLSQGEWRHFLGQARGSLYEVDANLILAIELRFIETEAYEDLRRRTVRVAQLIAGLIRHARRREKELQAKLASSRRTASTTVNGQRPTK